MQTKFKPVLIELFWVGIILNITVLLTIFVFGWTFLNHRFDIHLQDSYFAISSWIIVLPLFIFLTFFIFLIKEIPHQFQRRASNIIILTAGMILVMLITIINKQVIISETIYYAGKKGYPPLSAFNDIQPKTPLHPAVHVASNSLTVIQFIVTVCLLYVAYRMGANRKLIHNNNHIEKPRKQAEPVKPKEEVVKVK